MRIGTTITGDLDAMMREEVEIGARGVSAAMRAAGTDLKGRWRRSVSSALGRRMGYLVRSASYPQSGSSLNAAALVWTKSPKIVAAHAEGALIRSQNGFWLAIPTEAAGRARGGGRVTPYTWEKKTGLPLRFVFRRGRPSLLVAEGRLSKRGLAVASRSKTGRGLATVVVFILVPQVRLKKAFDLEGDIDAVAGSLAARIGANWRD